MPHDLHSTILAALDEHAREQFTPADTRAAEAEFERIVRGSIEQVTRVVVERTVPHSRWKPGVRR
jgi:hypothetical protein